MEHTKEQSGLTRLSFGLVLLSIAGSWALSTLLTVLLAAKIGTVVGEANKVNVLAAIATAANIAGFIIAVFAGHLSDKTRSRFGKRNSWIAGSGAGMLLSFALLTQASSTLTIGLCTALILVFITISKVITSAIIPDRVPVEKRGALSSSIAIGSLLGMAIGLSFGGMFITNVDTGLLITGIMTFVISMAFVGLVKEPSNKDQPKPSSNIPVWRSVLPPQNGKDFYWAIISRFLLVLGTQMILAYQLYIVTDHLKENASGVAQTLSWAAIAYTTGALAGGFIGGPLSDKLGKRKGLIVIAVAIIGSSILLLVFFPTITSFTLYKLFNGIGFGVYLAVHTALTSEVIPNGDSKAKDMSYLSVAMGLSGILAPVLSATAIGLGMGYTPLFLIATLLSLSSIFLIIPIKSVK